MYTTKIKTWTSYEGAVGVDTSDSGATRVASRGESNVYNYFNMDNSIKY